MHIMDVIKFDGAYQREWLLYKFPDEDFNNESRLIVGPGQIAICVHNGTIEHIFENGEYVLNVENIPFIKGFTKAVYGDKTPYKMEIYFINKRIKLDLLWGTGEAISIQDPRFGILVNVRARGAIGLKISDYVFFLKSIVGTIEDDGIVEFSSIQTIFRPIINSKIANEIGHYIIKNKISILDISSYYDEIGEVLLNKLTKPFKDYGFSIETFNIINIGANQEDLAKLKDILNKNAELNTIGDERYKNLRSYDVLDKAASNQGNGGGLIGAGVGLGVGIGIAKKTSEIVNDNIVEKKEDTPNYSICPKCGANNKKGAKFCSECGTKMQKYCTKCGAEVSSKAKFCPECGEKL